MKFSICTDMLFGGLPTHTLLEAVQQAGYNAVEFWDLDGKDEALLAEGLARHGLSLAAFCTTPRNLVDAQARTAFLDGLREHIAAAKRLGCNTLITTVGQRLDGVSDEVQRQSIIDGLRLAAPMLEADGITLVIEPLNILVDHIGYFLPRSADAFDILRAVDSPCVKLLYDVYHQQVTEGNLIDTITKNSSLIGHFHLADAPGRHEPGLGEINWRNVLRAIEASGYDGFVGLEYAPTYDAAESMRNIYEFLKSTI